MTLNEFLQQMDNDDTSDEVPQRLQAAAQRFVRIYVREYVDDHNAIDGVDRFQIRQALKLLQRMPHMRSEFLLSDAEIEDGIQWGESGDYEYL